MRNNSNSPSPTRNQQAQGASGSPDRGSNLFGANFPLGIDRNKITEEEIDNFLKMTSVKSLEQIALETEKLAGEASNGGPMMRGDEKITLNEIRNFMNGISNSSAEKVTKRDLREYLSAFPVKGQANGQPGEGVKVKRSEVNFLLNGKQEMTAQELHELLANTMIEEFDPVQEAFNLLDVEGEGYLSVDTFRNIFEKLNLGTIEPNEEKIFNEVADKDEDGRISLDDFRKILEYNVEGEDEDDIDANPGDLNQDVYNDMEGEGDMGDDYDDEDEEAM